MLEGIAHLHHVSIIHADIKTDNFLMGGEDGHTVKLADFGLAAQVEKGGTVTGISGTAPFMCPEMLSTRRYGEKADVWSFGAIVYLLMFGRFPYMPPERRNAKTMKQAILKGTPAPSFAVLSPAGTLEKRAAKSNFRSDDAVSFAKALLIREPRKRPSAEEALRMPWMRAAKLGEHAPNMDLPSLRPMLQLAKKIGAFEAPDLQTVSPVDGLLNALQMDRHLSGPRGQGIRIPIRIPTPELDPETGPQTP